MNQLESYEASTGQKNNKGQIFGNKYQIIKVLLSGDLLAKDNLQQLYLLCHMNQTGKLMNHHFYDQANIIQPLEVIKDENNNYQVFPFDKKLLWAGDQSNLIKKSEIHCVTLLYSAIRHIIKPLVHNKQLKSWTNFINTQNLWLRESSVFLFLRNKTQDKNIQRAQTISKKRYLKERDGSYEAQLTQIQIISKMGEVFWSMFYEQNTLQLEVSRPTFKQILKSMIKGQLNLVQLDEIMENKTARKRFINHNRNTIDATINYNTIDYNEPKNLFTTSIYVKLDQIPIRTAVPQRGLLFANERRFRQTNSPKLRERIGFGTLLQNSELKIPPSFSRGKRFKRRSLFDDTRSFSKGIKLNQRYNKQQNPKRKMRYSLTPNQNITNQNFSFAIQKTQKENTENKYKYGLNINRKKANTRYLFEQSYVKQPTERQKLQRRSQQKALMKIKQLKSSIDSKGDSFPSKIDDQKLKNHLKQIRLEYKNNVNKTMMNINQKINAQKSIKKQEQKQHEKIANADTMINQQLNVQIKTVSHPRFIQQIQHNQNRHQIVKNASQLVIAKKPVIHMQRQNSNVEIVALNKNNLIQQNQNQIKLQMHKNETQITNKEPLKEQKVQKKLENQEKKKTSLQLLLSDNEGVNKNNFYQKVQQNMFQQLDSPKDYVYVSKIQNKPIQMKNQNITNQASTSPSKKQRPVIKAPKYAINDVDEQIQQISLGTKKQIPPTAKKQLVKQPNSTVQLKYKKEEVPSSISNKKNEGVIVPIPNNKNRENQTVGKEPNPVGPVRQNSQNGGRVKTNNSNASSNGQKSIKKQMDQYIHMINKIGQAVAKTAKLSKKLQKIQWYTGVYFLYKRFFYQRKKIQKYLEQSLPLLTRYQPFNEQQWKQWLAKGELQQMLAKCRDDNKNIQNSIKKMVKKIEVKQLPGRVLLNSPVGKNNIESTKIAVEFVVDQYDQAVELGLQSDVQIFTHLCQMVNGLYVIAELDGKIKEKRPVIEFSNVKRQQNELSNMVQIIFDLYQQ